MKPLTLSEILNAIDGRPLFPTSPCRVTGISIDSRTLRTGDIFFAIKGERFDGHDFVHQALNKGALFAVVSKATRFTAELVVPQIIVVDDPIIALGQLAAYHRRQLAADVIAVITAATARPPPKQ